MLLYRISLTLLLINLNINFTYSQVADADIFFQKGILNEESGNYQKALEYYSKAIDKDSLNPKYYCYRGFCYQFLGEINENFYNLAITDINMSIKIDTTYSEGYYKLGIVRSNMKQNELACDAWEKAFNLGNNKAKVNLDEYCK